MAVCIVDVGVICSIGDTKRSVAQVLFNEAPPSHGLIKDATLAAEQQELYVGRVNSALPGLQHLKSTYRSRNNQMADAAYSQIADTVRSIMRTVSADRVAVVIGTSTSGIAEGEAAVLEYTQTQRWPKDFRYGKQEMFAPADFIASLAGATGPVYSLSTACTSSAKALASAKLLLESDLADMVICGGVDTLSRLPVNGFLSLESMSNSVCQPFSVARDGINIGEGAALFVLQRSNEGIAVCGVGESSDAYHISSPEPTGEGALKAMSAALHHGGINPDEVDYINLHGTGTLKNDEMEATAVYTLFKDQVSCSSTKHLTGHTLGAAGALEAAFCYLTLSELNPQRRLPPNGVEEIDAALAPISLSTGQTLPSIRYCLSNSFAFGGNNISLLMGDARGRV